MCGFFTHGFWWQEDNEYVVVADWEINSHTKIREYRKDLIPAEAKRWGFNPINGEPVTNEAEPLPEQVKEKIELLREIYFPNKEAIADWMRKNYGKQDDKGEWDMLLPLMLEDRGRGLFFKRYYTRLAQDYAQQAEGYTQLARNRIQPVQHAQYCTKQAQYYTQLAQYCTKWQAQYCIQIAQGYTRVAQYCTKQVQYYTQLAQEGTRLAQDYTRLAQGCIGDMDEIDIDKFIAYFLEHPNKFWAERNKPLEVEYKSFVKV